MDTTQLSSARRVRGVALGVVITALTVAGTLMVTSSATAQGTGIAQDFSASGNLFGPFVDETGFFSNATTDRTIVNDNNPFFTRRGANGQACVTCHQPSQGFSLVEPFIDFKFLVTQGRDPLFSLNDTADRPDAPVATLSQRRRAFALFLDLGVARIGKSIPATRDFDIVSQNTPRFGPLPSTNDPQAPGVPALSVFRRPLPTTNTRFDSAVLWDGRQNIHNLRKQVQAAARSLNQIPNLSNADADAIASFMTNVFTAQDVDFHAGSLSARGATGGAENLKNLITSGQAPCVEMTIPNNPIPFVPPVTPASPGCTNPFEPFDIFTAWNNLPRASEFRPGRESVARGETIFNTRQFSFPGAGTFTCTSCHATSNIGNFPLMFDPVNHTAPNASLFIRYGLDSPEFLAHLASLDTRMNSFVKRTADLPVYQVNLRTAPETCGPAILPNLRTGQPMLETLVRTTDPGRALVTGLCFDLGAMKPPTLRGLATRPPFFHNGAAETIEDVVNFYDVIFQARMSRQDREDLEAYLRAF
jgi:cytochrome c peroxidase